MRRLLKILVSFVFIIFIAYFFLIDIAIKTMIERAGSTALQAQMNIGSAKFHLMPTTLRLRDVQITDARAPLRNLLQADSIALPLQLGELFDRRLIIEEMQVHGLRFNRSRASSGAIDGVTPPTVADTSAENQRAQRHQQLREALQRVDGALANPATAANAQASGSITGVLIAGSLRPLLAQIINLMTPPPDSANSEWQIIAKHIAVDGQFDLGKQPLPFSGDLENVTPQPQQFNVVTRIELNGAETQAGKFALRGTLDFRKLAAVSLRVDLSNFPVVDLPLADDSDLTISLSRAQSDMQGLLSLTGNQIDLNVLARFHDASIAVTAGDEPELQSIANVLRNTTAFDLNLQASGAIDNPVMKLNSSLDQPLAAELLRLHPPQPSLFAPVGSGF